MARVKVDWGCKEEGCGAHGTRTAITEEVADFRAGLAKNDHVAVFHPGSLVGADGLPSRQGSYEYISPDGELLQEV